MSDNHSQILTNVYVRDSPEIGVKYILMNKSIYIYRCMLVTLFFLMITKLSKICEGRLDVL